ncbi:hypothetical protein [Aurantibacillus circumpalustris]|uniref:hypothetical protein n=1 Tax=Aurantibacillus circumpalustris TaxID=3036359 RepID=UPI00295AFA82|nr:hypothetical protein [Aurantibacillus circumpalustris]
MKIQLTLSLFLFALFFQAQNEKDYTLSKVKSSSGKYVFSNLEPLEPNSKAFYFQNKLKSGASLEEKMIQSVKNAMKESGLQGGEPFDAIIITDGELRSKAVKFTETSPRNALAKIGFVRMGVYIFVDCLPSNEYDYIATINCKWHTNPDERDKAFLELIERGKKKYSNFDGIIFKDDNHQTADLIKFRGLELSGGGFRIGDKAIFGSSKEPQYGEVVQLDNKKQSASVKFLDEYGDDAIKKVDYAKLTPLSNEQYDKYAQEIQIKIALHKFDVAEKVSWVDSKTAMYGEVVSLNSRNHDVNLKYLNIYGEEKIKTLDRLEVEKLPEDKFQTIRKNELEEIAKHQFKLSEKIIFKDDKLVKYGEVVGLNDQNHKASIKHLGVFAEERVKDIPYLELGKTSEELYKNGIAKDIEAAQKYKFTSGEKVNWSKSGFLGTNSEIVPCEIISTDDLNHKATVKYLTKDNVEKQETVSHLDLTKTQ